MKWLPLALAIGLFCSISNLPPRPSAVRPTPPVLGLLSPSVRSTPGKGTLTNARRRPHRRAWRRRHPYPAWWMAQAHCIHWHEAVSSSPATAAQLRAGWRIHWHLTKTWDGRPSVNHGGFQINVATWRSYAPNGYPGDPADATRAQQVRVAHAIWTANGHRWGGSQWPGTAAACGVR